MSARLADLIRLRKELDRQIASEVAVLERLAKEARATQRRLKVAACGTDSGYYRHKRTLGEPPCEACRQAHADYERGRTARKNAKDAA